MWDEPCKSSAKGGNLGLGFLGMGGDLSRFSKEMMISISLFCISLTHWYFSSIGLDTERGT